MNKAKISELRDRLSYYLRKVRQGESVEVVDRNVPVARLVPVRPASDHADSLLARLRSAGLVKVGPMKGIEEILSRKPSGQSSGVLNALVEERRQGR